MKTCLVLYVPALHRNYQVFFQKYAGAELYLLTNEDLGAFEPLAYLKKDLRRLDPPLVESAIKAWKIFKQVQPLSVAELPNFVQAHLDDEIILSNDDIGQFLQQKFFRHHLHLQLAPFFLRWDKNTITQDQVIEADIQITKKDFERRLMKTAFAQAYLSSDWWRQVGALIVKDQEVLLTAFNQHLPVTQQQNLLGDPRCFFESGQGIELSSSIHAEALLIATAAKKGLALAGSDLYCSTFPCPLCAKQIAAAGLAHLYFAQGYAKLDGLEILQTAGVEVIQVLFTPTEIQQLQQEQRQHTTAQPCYKLDKS